MKNHVFQKMTHVNNVFTTLSIVKIMKKGIDAHKEKCQNYQFGKLAVNMVNMAHKKILMQ